MEITFKATDQTQGGTLTDRLIKDGWDVDRRIVTGPGVPLYVEITASKEDGDADSISLTDLDAVQIV